MTSSDLTCLRTSAAFGLQLCFQCWGVAGKHQCCFRLVVGQQRYRVWIKIWIGTHGDTINTIIAVTYIVNYNYCETGIEIDLAGFSPRIRAKIQIRVSSRKRLAINRQRETFVVCFVFVTCDGTCTDRVTSRARSADRATKHILTA